MRIITFYPASFYLDRTVSPAGWSKRRQRTETIGLEEDIETIAVKAPKANVQAPQTLFTCHKRDLQSVSRASIDEIRYM